MDEIGREETVCPVHPVSGTAQDVSQRLTDSIPEQCCKSGFRSLAKVKGFPSSISVSGVSFSLLVRLLTSAYFGWPGVLCGEAYAGDCKQRPSLGVLQFRGEK